MVETPTAPPGPRPEQTMPLLALITQRSLDADYEHVAARKRAAGQDPSVRQVPRRTAAIVLLAFGLLVTVAAVQTSRNASVDEASRSSLIDQINLRRQAVADQQQQLSRQQADQLALQRSLTRVNTETQAAQARLARVRARTGFGAVKGLASRRRSPARPAATTTSWSVTPTSRCSPTPCGPRAPRRSASTASASPC